MNEPIFKHFKSINAYETHQKNLSTSLGISGLVLVPIRICNLMRGSIESAVPLFVIILISLASLYLNHRGNFNLSVAICITYAYFSIFFNSANSNRLSDKGLIPLLILTFMAGVISSKLTSILLTTLSILAVWLFHSLPIVGILALEDVTGLSTQLIFSLLLVVIDALQYIVMDYWKQNLLWLPYSEGQVRGAFEKMVAGSASALERLNPIAQELLAEIQSKLARADQPYQ